VQVANHVGREYTLSFKRKQLNAGGATQFFEAYVKAYPAARTSAEKMLAIDRLIHEFHYSYKFCPDQPTRPAGVNLIEGNLTSVITFLDELSGLTPKLPGIAATRQQWQDTFQQFQEADWKAITAEHRSQRSRKERGSTIFTPSLPSLQRWCSFSHLTPKSTISGCDTK
jgi:hypothetical protein